MKNRIKFYQIGNGDTTLITTESGKNILFDYAHLKNGDDDDLRCDLPSELNKDVTSDSFDVVAFTHADIDHVKRFSEYFYLEHASKYQAGVRKKITELWVPAHVILEEGCEDDTRILRAEARYRLKNKSGIKVFSKPDNLKGWLEKEDIKFSDVEHLIVNAGQTVPGWDNSNPELEFFVHAPFSYYLDEHTEITRNDSSLVMQATFKNTYKTKLLLTGDADWELLHEIVAITERFENTGKLLWDIMHISHHCSYLSLAPEKGETKTEPVDPVRRLFEDYSLKGCILISPSYEIPLDYDTIQPPHRQAFNYYKSVAEDKSGEIKILMEFPSKANPKPLEITVDSQGATIVKTAVSSGFVSERKPPRAG